ncbi:MAG: hypothetical protein KGJ78_18750 [Alphaproteobacteria bacterium]|nr:hypothetical protein [Alphaproteobacteria bacterium]
MKRVWQQETAISDFAYDTSGYEARAEECVRLAFATEDSLLREQLLSLRENYLGIARRLKDRERPPSLH